MREEVEQTATDFNNRHPQKMSELAEVARDEQREMYEPYKSVVTFEDKVRCVILSLLFIKISLVTD
jgi:hypothetical protein